MFAITGRLFRYFIVPAAVGAVWLSLPTPPAEARPQYLEQFKKTYEPLAETAGTKKCSVCHGMGKKTERNKYGEAISGVLGESRNVKDNEAIEKALRSAEAKPSSSEGKTFGDLIKEGVLPE